MLGNLGPVLTGEFYFQDAEVACLVFNDGIGVGSESRVFK